MYLSRPIAPSQREAGIKEVVCVCVCVCVCVYIIAEQIHVHIAASPCNSFYLLFYQLV